MIEITGLTKRDGSHTVLDNIDFTVETGTIAAVVGASGAGKSTLFRCVNLLERPTSGTVRVDGQELAHLSPRELRVARRCCSRTRPRRDSTRRRPDRSCGCSPSSATTSASRSSSSRMRWTWCAASPTSWPTLITAGSVSYTHLRAHETRHDLVCRL